MPSYITHHRATLEQRHYIIDATLDTMFFNFWEGRFTDYIGINGNAFCLVINGSIITDHAFILPFAIFRDFFTPDFLDARHRWVGNIRAHDESMVISAHGHSKEKPVFEYHNAFHMLQDAPLPLPKAPDISEFV
jgi:hypothetical protein